METTTTKTSPEFDAYMTFFTWIVGLLTGVGETFPRVDIVVTGTRILVTGADLDEVRAAFKAVVARIPESDRKRLRVVKRRGFKFYRCGYDGSDYRAEIALRDEDGPERLAVILGMSKTKAV